ncbi:uncharacterized protein H6S33_000746 [Morchella sextelata]|uniref:uncharacterized protein n=1 Tax=Morchella sextelata TaxID=1174677 RepID=UPI001D049CCA|nr:uncharacterized protein H6S33_000746 [Morchella sextelata]KAH0615110.1 hypothetical protein H6S33_000746 [Morchella sextelata]
MADSSDTNMDSPTIDTVDSSTIDGSAFGSSAPSSVQGEPREHSPPPTVTHISYNNPTIPPGPIQLKRRVSSRLPVPKKSSVPTPAPINVPQPYGSLRTASSRESLVSPGPKSASPRFPSVAKRQSRIGGPSYNGGGLSSPIESPSISLGLKSPRVIESNIRGDHTSHTATSLAKRASVPSLTRKPSTSSLTRKVSASQLQTQAPTPARKTSTSGPSIPAPPLTRKLSNSSMVVNKRASNSHLNRKVSVSNLPSHDTASQSPTPMRRSISSGLPSPMTPTKLPPPRTGQSGLRQPSLKTPRPAPTNTRNKTPEPQRTETPDSPMSRKAAANKASQSLRDTIAKARAAHRARAESIAQSITGSVAGSVSDGLDGFNFSTDDPFNQAIFGEGSSQRVMKQRIRTARVEGRLNISNLQLKEIPVEVYKMYETSVADLEAADAGDGPKWYESVDLVRFVGADNEIEEIGQELVEQFGGLTSIDMHNNMLITLPKNFADLTELTVLNLTNNKLDHDALEIIFQIKTLVDLKLAKNGLEGELPSSIYKLGNLEILELQENKLDSLPSSLGDLSRLHILNVHANRLQEIPLQVLKNCQLQELTASSNKLGGTLFSLDVESLNSLHLLDVRNNRISKFSEGTVLLPTLQQLYATNNELSLFPSVEGWNELLVFTVDSNRLEALPEGLLNLQRLRTLDFSSNNIKSLDPRLGMMEGLEILKFDGNPLRERNLLNMGILDLKRTLKARLAPPEIVIAEADDNVQASDAGPGFVDAEGVEEEEEDAMAHKKALEIGRGGVLDLASKNYEEIPTDLLESVVGSPSSIVLLHNKLTTIPASIETFCASLTIIDISHNKLSGDAYLPTKISLRTLTTFTLQSNGITSLKPLLDNLDAPKLESLDVSVNRIESIEGIRPTFPHLTAFYARDNRIEEIPVDSVDGVRILDLNSNSIKHLPPQLGTVASLRELRVTGNLFRVPRWQVLEKGTEGIMEWLRDRLPAEEEVE